MTTPLPPNRAVINGVEVELTRPDELVGKIVSIMLHNGRQVCGVEILAVEPEPGTGKERLVYRLPTTAGNSKVTLDGIAFLYLGDDHHVDVGDHALANGAGVIEAACALVDAWASNQLTTGRPLVDAVDAFRGGPARRRTPRGSKLPGIDITGKETT